MPAQIVELRIGGFAGDVPIVIAHHGIEGETGKAAGEAAERPLVADDFVRASEAFATNSAGIRGVVCVDGRDVGGGVPGPIFERLRAMV